MQETMQAMGALISLVLFVAAIINLIVLIVFFTMASNVSTIKKRLLHIEMHNHNLVQLLERMLKKNDQPN